MAKSADELFDVFAARLAQILHERHRMDAASLLRVRRTERVVEGMTHRTRDGAPQWHEMRPSLEQLEWDGPDVVAARFAREYLAAYEAVNR